MAFNEISPMLYTRDRQGTVDFFVQHLGFTCGEYDADQGWASFHRDHVTLMASFPNEHIPFTDPHFTGSFYIRVDNVDVYGAEFSRNQAKRMCYPIENFDYGMREFAFFEHNGYLIQIGQDLGTKPDVKPLT